MKHVRFEAPKTRVKSGGNCSIADSLRSQGVFTEDPDDDLYAQVQDQHVGLAKRSGRQPCNTKTNLYFTRWLRCGQEQCGKVLLWLIA
jgi:hypothetical protein